MQQGKNSHRASSKSKNRAISSSIGRNTHRPAGSVLQTLNPWPGARTRPGIPRTLGVHSRGRGRAGQPGEAPSAQKVGLPDPSDSSRDLGSGGEGGEGFDTKTDWESQMGRFLHKTPPLTCPPSLWQEPHSPTGGTAGHPATQRTCCHAPPTFQNKTSKHYEFLL